MFDQYEREELDRIEQWFKYADPALARAFEDGRLPRRYSGRNPAAIVAGYVGAAFLIGLGTARVELLLFILGSVALSLTGCLHVLSWARRRYDGWSTS